MSLSFNNSTLKENEHTMKCVFLDKATFADNINLDLIKQQVDTFEVYDLTNAEQVVERCKNAEIIITNKVVFNESTLQKLPRLKLICIAATGINNVNVKAAKNLGIAVTNVSGYSSHSVAQYVFSQLLHYVSEPNHHIDNVKQGCWQQSPSFCFHGHGSTELAGKTMAIVGYGNIGKTVALIAQAFGMTVLVAEQQNASLIREGRVSFLQAIQEADFVSIHCPLTDNTANLFNADIFNKMKPTAVLINTARGNIVNESDLITALTNNKIAYAILDVLAQEPPPVDYNTLINQPDNLVITAHIAWASIESQQRLINLVAKNIKAFSQGELLNRVD